MSSKPELTREQAALLTDGVSAAAIIAQRTEGLVTEREAICARFPSLAAEFAVRDAYVQGVIDGFKIAEYDLKA